MLKVPWLLCGDFNTELNITDRSDYYDGMTCSQNAIDLDTVWMLLRPMIFLALDLF